MAKTPDLHSGDVSVRFRVPPQNHTVMRNCCVKTLNIGLFVQRLGYQHVKLVMGVRFSYRPQRDL